MSKKKCDDIGRIAAALHTQTDTRTCLIHHSWWQLVMRSVAVMNDVWWKMCVVIIFIFFDLDNHPTLVCCRAIIFLGFIIFSSREFFFARRKNRREERRQWCPCTVMDGYWPHDGCVEATEGNGLVTSTLFFSSSYFWRRRRCCRCCLFLTATVRRRDLVYIREFFITLVDSKKQTKEKKRSPRIYISISTKALSMYSCRGPRVNFELRSCHPPETGM